MKKHLFSQIPSGKRILITGGAGFIGTAIAEKIADANEIVLFDQRFDGMPVSFSGLPRHKNVRCVTGDILDTAAVKELTSSVDVIIHLAALVGVRNVLRRSRETIKVNFTGTSNLLAATEGRSLERFVYFSTSEVFGVNSFRVDEMISPSIGSVTEARWSYAIAKLAGEHLLHAYHRELELPSVIIRPFNVFGPNRLGDHAMLRFIVAGLTNAPMEIHGDGSQIRSWCYIDDFVDGVLRTIVRPEAIGQDFNLGNAANTLTIYDLAKRVRDMLEATSPIKFVKVDFSDIDIRVPRTMKAEDLLDFRPVYELEEAVPLTASWYRTNLEFVQKVLAAS